MYGYNVDANHVLFEETPLPNATSINSGNDSVTGALGAMVRITCPMELRIYANTAIEVAAGGALSFELVTYSEDDYSSAAELWNSSGMWAEDAHFLPISKTTADDAMFAGAGQLMQMFAITPDMLRDRPFIALKVTASGDLSAQKIDAFLRPIA